MPPLAAQANKTRAQVFNNKVCSLFLSVCPLPPSAQYGRAPIHWASSRGSTEIMEMLIAAKCDIEANDKYGMRPLLMAAWHGHSDAAKMLINCGASVNAVN
ncbi:hypothetical protein FOCC_FOCC016962, partial [Frankliniella occidentalis]